MDINAQTTAAVTRERLDRKWSLRTAAKRSKLSVGVWQRLEKGEPVHQQSLYAVAKAFGWTHDDLERLQAGEDFHPRSALRDAADAVTTALQGTAPNLPNWTDDHAARLAEAGEDLTEREKERLVQAAERTAAPRQTIEDHAYAADSDTLAAAHGLDIEEIIASSKGVRFNPPDDAENWGA